MSPQLQTQRVNSQIVKITEALNNYKTKIAQVLPQGRNADQEIVSVLATISSEPKLQRCSAESIAQACFDAASIGLTINKLGLAYLVPYGEQVKLTIGYKGYVELALRSGLVLDIFAECVYSKDKFRYLAGTTQTIIHEPVIVGDRGELIAVYAVARLVNDIVKPCVMRKNDIDFIRSKSRATGASPWNTDYDEMAKKTVVKRLCKLLPQGCLPERLHQVEDKNEVIDIEVDDSDEVSYEAEESKPPFLDPKQKRIIRIKELLEKERELTGYNADIPNEMDFINWSVEQLNKYGSDLLERIQRCKKAI
ncbi:MAG: recombinase RecT [Blastocatellia bacterium]